MHFILEENNKWDSDAVAVFTDQGQIGYLKKDSKIRRMIKAKLKNNQTINVHILSTQMADVGLYGVVIAIEK